MINRATLDLYTPNKTQVTESIRFEDVSDPQIADLVGDADALKLQEDLEMIEGVYNPFSQEEYLAGELAPVFFGSALNTFGVKELLDCFIEIALSNSDIILPILSKKKTVNNDNNNKKITLKQFLYSFF